MRITDTMIDRHYELNSPLQRHRAPEPEEELGDCEPWEIERDMRFEEEE